MISQFLLSFGTPPFSKESNSFFDHNTHASDLAVAGAKMIVKTIMHNKKISLENIFRASV